MKKIYRTVVIVTLGCLPLDNMAAPVTPDAGLIMRESSKLPPAVPTKPVEPQIEQAPLKMPMTTQDNLHVKLQSFRFSGNTQFDTPTLQQVLAAYSNREVSFGDLQQAANTITEYYRSKGFFVAYAYIPEQTLDNGQIELAIFEGRLDDQHLQGQNITLLNNTRIKKGVLQKYLDTYPQDSIITESNMDHLSLLLNQLPGINAKVVLSPGKSAGTSSLALKIKEAPAMTGFGSVDNYGLYATGYYRLNAGLSFNDPLGLGDQLNLRAQSTETGDSVAGWADYSLPINGYGTRVGINFAELHYALGRSFTYLKADGLARSVGATISQPLYLKRNAQITGFAHYEHRWMQDKTANFVDSHNDRELNAMSYSFAGNFTDTLLVEPGLTQAFINVAAGQVSFANQNAFVNDQTNQLHTSGGYHKFNWQLNRTQNVWGPFSMYVNYQGQIASKNLDSSEQISLGGPYGIRAYPVGEGSADEGWLFNGEMRYRLPNVPSVPGYFQLIGFVDTGYFRVNARALSGDNHNSQHLTGYGFGINWLDIAGFSVRTSLAWRDSSKTPASDPNASGPMGYFQLNKQF
jgi:hemolysin activation/secretion protein